MEFFDLHCDTAYECAVRGGGTGLREGARHLSLDRGQYLENWTQVFAVFMPDEYRGARAIRHYERVRDYLYRQESLLAGRLEILRDAASFSGSRAECRAVLSVEGGSALAGDPERLRALYDDGVRLITLTWNAPNELGDGVLSEEGRGLTEAGRAVVRGMNRLGMAVDVSHLSDAGFRDVADISEIPFIASHSDARSLCGNPRNLTDGMIREIAGRGGLIGLNFHAAFLRDGGQATAADILRHAEHMLALGCGKALCLGSDFDGCDLPCGMTGIESAGALYEDFLRENYSEDLVRDIFSRNARRYFAKYIFKD